jgi:hypothetical protein
MLPLQNLNYGGDLQKLLNPELTDYIMKLKMKAELDATIDLAIINGPFPSYDLEKEFHFEMNSKGDGYYGNNNFFNFLLESFPEQTKRMLQYGRRNVSFSTINGGLIE